MVQYPAHQLKTELDKQLDTHLVLFHQKAWTNQPQGAQMGSITNNLKSQKSHLFYTINDILRNFSHGHCGILAHVNTNMEFVSTDIIAIDVDDDKQETDPEQAFIESKATGLFYTFSHGKKGNRYRLLFRLDKPITNLEHCKAVMELVAEELIKKGIPADRQVNSPKQIIRGGQGRSNYLINEGNHLSTTQLLKQAKERAEDRLKRLYKRLEARGEKEYRIYPFEELKEMAECIGHIPTNSGRNEEWTQLCLSIKSYELEGHITHEQGFELFTIISGGEETETRYNGFRPKMMTIGTFVKEAKKCGYTNKYYFTEGRAPTQKKTYEEVKKKVTKYIPSDYAMELINTKERVLIASPTGSGKSTAFIVGCKTLETANNHVYIFSAPYVKLVEQLTNKHDVQAVYGANDKKLYQNIYHYVKNQNKRVFVCTYDMTPVLVQFLRKVISTDLSFTLIVDEYHKTVTDYAKVYRREAIRNLEEVSKQARTFIALSGTTDDIDKNDFDKVIDVDNGQKASPITDFAIYTYENQKNGIPELTEVIKASSKHRKVLAFIETKEQIQLIAKALRKQGIKTATLTADDKRNAMFKNISENESIGHEVQVILSTSVIADGVNILNDSARFEVIAVCTNFSPLFNPSTLKQMSNRLRNPYDRFSIFMQEQKNEDPKKIYSVDARYFDQMRIAERLANDFNQDDFFDPLLFKESIVENHYALYLDDNKQVRYDRKELRHLASIDQQRFYKGKRLAFIEAVKRLLHVKEARFLNVSKEIRDKRLSMAIVENLLAEQQEQKELDDEQKKTALGTAFTKEVYKAFRMNDQETLQAFKKLVLPRHYQHLSRTTNYIGFETCLHLVRQVQDDGRTHAFMNDVGALIDIIYFGSLKRKNKNQQVIEEYLKLNELVSNEEYKDMMKAVAKKVKLKVKDVTAFKHYFIYEEVRQGKNRERFKRVVGTITIEHVADKYKLEIGTLKQIMINYANSHPTKAVSSVIKSKLNL